MPRAWMVIAAMAAVGCSSAERAPKAPGVQVSIEDEDQVAALRRLQEREGLASPEEAVRYLVRQRAARDRIARIQPLYASWFLVDGAARCGAPRLPTRVGAAIAERYETWGVASTEVLELDGGARLYRVLLSNGQSTHPSLDQWAGIEIDESGRTVRTWTPTPRRGPFEVEPAIPDDWPPLPGFRWR